MEQTHGSQELTADPKESDPRGRRVALTQEVESLLMVMLRGAFHEDQAMTLKKVLWTGQGRQIVCFQSDPIECAACFHDFLDTTIQTLDIR
jgi:hypothetical protein